MPTQMKDVLSEATGSGPTTSASGAEIPVTVHASRYSATSKGSGKLPPVHEDTRTVIIFPQGAVVRLAAMVTVGELVVLTNNRTGADVICRVTNVKTQPGIQNYVHLEFTQRALDFWEEAASTGRGTSGGKAPVQATPPAVVPASASAASDSGTFSSPLRGNQPTPKSTVPDTEAHIISEPLPKITPLADLPAVGSSEASATILPAQSQASEIGSRAAAAQIQSPAASPHALRLQPFEAVIPQKTNGSKSIFLIAIAAAVLLAIGVVGGPALLQRYHALIESPQVSNPPIAPVRAFTPVASEPAAPITNTSAKLNSVEAPASTLTKNSPAEAPLARQTPVQPAVEPPQTAEVHPQAITRPTLNISKIPTPRLKTAKQANSSEPPPVLPTSVDTLPRTLGESDTMARTNAFPTAQPAAPAPPIGGKLQQPKLLSSVAAVYPPLARTQHVQGDVTIDALIDATGKVSATNVITGNALLRNAAINALRVWKYQPAQLNGEPIPIHIQVTISFHLN
jgi:TonB family protein